MKKKSDGNGYKESEIVLLSHWDKKENKWVKTIYPKISGRLRLAHEENEELSISTEILRNDENVAVVIAKTVTRKGTFNGIGMASTERDVNIAPAILELAETRAIARSLRFAGYGFEYCSAEEVSHLGKAERSSQTSENKSENKESGRNNSGSGNGKGENGNGTNGRLSNKQLNYLVTLGKNVGMDTRELDKQSVTKFGVRLGHLTKKDASLFIDTIKNPQM